MSITQEEIIEHASSYFATLKTVGSADRLASFFLNSGPRIILADTGATISMEELSDLHRQWTDEKFEFSPYSIMPLSADPVRARVLATVYWEAGSAGLARPIKNIVGEDWILERTPGGELKFVLYINTFHHLLPDSAPIPF